MDGQIFTTLLHEVGPKWACTIGVGIWFWRCTPWIGRQLEKLIDWWIDDRQVKHAAPASTEAK